MKYRKKPVVIDAWPWPEIPEDAKEMVDDMGGLIAFHMVHIFEGSMKRAKGDWLIRGVQGEYYSCKPDIFEQTYEEAQEDV
jgi:hypothetical protein